MFDISTIRHSLSHILAASVLKVRPKTKLGIGPAISNGFYYDFLFAEEFSAEELNNIEKTMKHMVKQRIPFEKFDLGIDDAIEHFQKVDDTFKMELIEDLAKEGETKVSFYKMGEFVDLCKGPHVNNTGDIPLDTFKLDKLAGAYWKGDEHRPMMTRIYGLAFSTAPELADFINKREEALKRDHRKLGTELDLFSIHEDVGPGLVFWHPKGARIRNTIEDFWKKEHFKNGYEILYTPHIGKSHLWETSGHLGFFKENMYAPMKVDEFDFYIKPMNCPFHIEIYKTKKHSYRDLPLRWAELGTVYRYEKSGVLHGLLRVRGFTQDDAHIICTPEQIESEIKEVLRFSLNMWNLFGFKEIKAYVSTKPANSPGDDASWDKATDYIKKALDSEKMDYEVDEGGGAFYGPKIDLKIKDAIDREWQMTTIQFDFNLPERFKMTYTDNEGQEKRPYMVHRALLGSLERFFGVLIEHYAGSFPLWLAPIQVRLLSVAERHNQFVEDLAKKMIQQGLRVEVDTRNESMGKKIREGRLQRIPYLGVIGDRDIENNFVTVRNRNTQAQSEVQIDKFIEALKKEEEQKSLDLSI